MQAKILISTKSNDVIIGTLHYIVLLSSPTLKSLVELNPTKLIYFN